MFSLDDAFRATIREAVREAVRDELRQLQALHAPAQAPAAAGELLTANEAARVLRVDRETVYDMIRAGRLQATRIGSRWRIARHDLDRLTEAENGANTTDKQIDAKVFQLMA